jgi:endonuclease/exonuclease/phosphatase family metal-dependent hydrolase
MLDSLTSLLINKSPVIIAGDLNAWSSEWGSRETNQRGQSTLLAMAHLDVLVANQGNEHTFISGLGRGSVVDVTFCSPILLPNLKWRVGKE